MAQETLAEETNDLIALEAEQAILGTLLLSNDAYDRISAIIQAEDFSEDLHQRIFLAAQAEILAGRTASPLTLAPQFEGDPAMKMIGGVGYLANLAASSMPVSIVGDFCRMVRSYSVRRSIGGIISILESKFKRPEAGQEPEDFIDEAQGELDRILARKTLTDAVAIEAAGDLALDMVARAFERDGGMIGEPSGILALDNHFGGFERSDLIIIAGRPGMGKSALALSIAKNMSERPDDEGERRKGIVFSLEMSSWQLAQRWLAMKTGIPLTRIKRGQVSEAEFRLLRTAKEMLSGNGLQIDDSGGMSINQLRARVRRFKRIQGRLDFIIVDYIQLLAGSDYRQRQGRTQEVTEITVALKAIAKDFKVPVIALSQLSRQVENRHDKRPMLADLRESGSIEQDADIVLMCFREHYYLEQEGPPKDDGERADYEHELRKTEGEAQVICAKWRSGPTKTFHLSFIPQTTEFKDLEGAHG